MSQYNLRSKGLKLTEQHFPYQVVQQSPTSHSKLLWDLGFPPIDAALSTHRQSPVVRDLSSYNLTMATDGPPLGPTDLGSKIEQINATLKKRHLEWIELTNTHRNLGGRNDHLVDCCCTDCTNIHRVEKSMRVIHDNITDLERTRQEYITQLRTQDDDGSGMTSPPSGPQSKKAHPYAHSTPVAPIEGQHPEHPVTGDLPTTQPKGARFADTIEYYDSDNDEFVQAPITPGEDGGQADRDSTPLDDPRNTGYQIEDPVDSSRRGLSPDPQKGDLDVLWMKDLSADTKRMGIEDTNHTRGNPVENNDDVSLASGASNEMDWDGFQQDLLTGDPQSQPRVPPRDPSVDSITEVKTLNHEYDHRDIRLHENDQAAPIATPHVPRRQDQRDQDVLVSAVREGVTLLDTKNEQTQLPLPQVRPKKTGGYQLDEDLYLATSAKSQNHMGKGDDPKPRKGTWESSRSVLSKQMAPQSTDGQGPDLHPSRDRTHELSHKMMYEPSVNTKLAMPKPRYRDLSSDRTQGSQESRYGRKLNSDELRRTASYSHLHDLHTNQRTLGSKHIDNRRSSLSSSQYPGVPELWLKPAKTHHPDVARLEDLHVARTDQGHGIENLTKSITNPTQSLARTNNIA